jgi:Asp-tRNA(Asn)/Glu-tRNA(Gln) amidotransferase A subunit family amidase
MNDSDLAFASIEEVARLFRKRKLSPVELTKLMLVRIEQLNPKLNAYITVTAELALAQAKKAASELFPPRGRKGHRDRGPLHGIPISLKDNIYTEGIRTTAGSAEFGDDVRSRLEMGCKVPAVDYLRAVDIQKQFFQQLHLAPAEADVDAIVYPSTAIEAPLLNQETIHIGAHDYPVRALLLRHNRPANLAGVPAVSLPCGFTRSGLPIGLQIMAGVSSEPILLRIAKIFEHSRSQIFRPSLVV